MIRFNNDILLFFVGIYQREIYFKVVFNTLIMSLFAIFIITIIKNCLKPDSPLRMKLQTIIENIILLFCVCFFIVGFLFLTYYLASVFKD